MVSKLCATEWLSIPCLAHAMQLAISDAKKLTPDFSEDQMLEIIVVVFKGKKDLVV